MMVEASARNCSSSWTVLQAAHRLCRRYDFESKSAGVPTNVRLAEAAGADAVLIKPCLPQELAAEIRRLLSQSHELKARGRELREKVGTQRAKSQELIQRSEANQRRVALSRVHRRGATSAPPVAPPALLCPTCDQQMKYVTSQIGGVSERYPEQWDYFECKACRGTFEYRHRTRKLRASDPLRS